MANGHFADEIGESLCVWSLHVALGAVTSPTSGGWGTARKAKSNTKPQQNRMSAKLKNSELLAPSSDKFRVL